MADLPSLRAALLELHRELLEAQRKEAERFGGRMSASETLQAAVDDLRFSWLRTVSALISELDEAAGADDSEGRAAAGQVVGHARDLFVPPDPDTSFGARYLRALQDHPGVVLAHRDVIAALEVEPGEHHAGVERHPPSSSAEAVAAGGRLACGDQKPRPHPQPP